ncbi:HAD hydrolase-like protein [Henriciella sp.]|uniref:HAD-IIA family hydrolase n=1 Tax=Henriciella sp. TaxID=1968823 RepID=UPI0026184556|nr:HAD hydrolase-like protein [Henriciella sp.]
MSGDSGVWQTLTPEDTHVLGSTSGFIVDWDGCCALDNRLLPNASRFLRQVQDRVVILSNNSSDTPDTFESILADAGIQIDRDRIILAGTSAIEHAIAIQAERAMILGSSKMKAYARNAGLNIVRDHPDTVLLLRDTHLSYTRLESAVNAIASGAKLIVANPDLTHTGERGRIKPETGALLAALKACISLPPSSYEVVGKPAAPLFYRALARLDLGPSQTVMIGDNAKTDLAGAQRLGIPCLLVGDQPDQMMWTLAEQLEALD